MTFTAQDKLDAVKREIGYRKHVYARRVEQGKMTQQKANHEIAVFEAIHGDHEAAASKERLL